MDRFFHSLKFLIRECPVTFYLILINALAFVVTLGTGGFETVNLVRLGGLAPVLAVQDGEYWRVLTSMFLHGGTLHFIVNMIALYYLGVPSERGMGSLRYLILYVLSGIGSGVAVILLEDEYTLTVGASGALYGLMAALFLTTLRKRDWFSPASARSIRSMIIMNFAITFLFPSISISGHLGGFAVGLVAGLVLIPEIPHFARRADNPMDWKPSDPKDPKDPEDPLA